MAGPPPSDRSIEKPSTEAAADASDTTDSNLESSIGVAFARIAPDLSLVEASLRDQLESKVELIGVLGSRPSCAATRGRGESSWRLRSSFCIRRRCCTMMSSIWLKCAEVFRRRMQFGVIGARFLLAIFFTRVLLRSSLKTGISRSSRATRERSGQIAEGELLQLERSFDVDVTEAHYFDVIERKSATLLSHCCEIGSLLGGVTRGERNRIREYGRQLGLAFQLRDDCLDYESELEELGKQPFADLREGKITLPLILTLKRCQLGEREQISSVLKSAARLADENGGLAPSVASELDLAPVTELVNRYHGLRDTVRRAEDHVAKALEAIAPFPDGPAKSALRAAAEFSVARDR